MNLMPNESIVRETERKTLVLTTHRVRYQAEGFGNIEIRRIMLEELASCAMVHASNTILLIAAGMFFILGLAVYASAPRNEGPLILGVALAVVLVIAYFASRRQILALASAGTTIRVNTQVIKSDFIKQFIEQIEAAKNLRYLHARNQA